MASSRVARTRAVRATEANVLEAREQWGYAGLVADHISPLSVLTCRRKLFDLESGFQKGGTIMRYSWPSPCASSSRMMPQVLEVMSEDHPMNIHVEARAIQ